MTLRTVGVRLTAEIGEYQSKLKAAGQSTRDFKGELDKAAKKGSLDNVAKVAGGVGLALVGMAGYALKSAADFDKAMSAVSAATHAPKAEMDQLRAAALQAGKDTMYSATQAADGVTQLAKAGVSTADILGGGLKGALSLAAAGQLEVGTAAEIAASALTQFKLQGSQIPHVADLLAAGAGKAQGSVQDIGMALNQSGLVAAQFKLSIEDTTGALAEFASAGLIGSDAGTSLKTMLLAIANPTTQTTKLMNSLGISFYDAQGKFIGMSGVAQVLQTRLAGLTDAQRQQALGQIFGNDAIRAASILYTDGAAGVAKWKNAVNDSGYAAATAAKQTDNLAGDLERLKGSLDTLAINAGSGGNSGLRILTKGLNDVVNAFIGLPPVIGSTVTVLVGLSGVLLVGGAAWVKYRKFMTEAQTQLIATGPAGEKAAAGLSGITSVLGKAAVAFAVWQTAMVAADAISNKTSTNVDALTQGLQKFGGGADLSGEAARVLGSNLDNLKTGFAFLANTDNGRDQAMVRLQKGLEASIPGLKDYNTSLSNTQAQISAVDSSLAQLVTTGHAQDAANAFQRLAAQLAVNGVSMDEFKKMFPGYEAALGTAKSATQGATGQLGDLNSALTQGASAQNKYKTVAEATAGAARGERDAIGALYAEIKGETDPTFAFIAAQNKLRDSQTAATKAIKDHGKNSTQAKAADLDLAQAALGLQNASGNLSQSFNGKLSPAFAATLKAAGLTKGEIANVTKQFGDAKKSADKYTGKYAAAVSAPGATTAKKQIDLAYTSANGFAGPYIARLSINGAGPVSAALDDLLVKQRALQTGLSVSAARAAVQKDLDRNRQRAYAEGGQVGGWSPHSRADNIPAMLTANEWVHPVDSVKYYGPQVMSAIQHRQVPRGVLAAFATGELGKMGDLPIGLASGGQATWQFVENAARTKIPSWAQVESKIPGGGAAGPFLRAQNGKPYVWASAGPGGYDCSGIVSAVYNLLHGKSPYSHTFSTGSLPGGWFTTPGIGGPLTAAWSNPGESPASSSTGHMMGMAGGLTFESTGGRGVHLGSTTRRLTDFAHIAHYNQGGHVAMASGGTIAEPVFGIGSSGRTYSFGEAGPEYVTPQWQAGAQSGGGTSLHFSFSGPVGSRYELENWLTGAIDNLKRTGRV